MCHCFRKTWNFRRLIRSMKQREFFQSFIKSNERIKDSYTGLDCLCFFKILFFFQEKILKFIHAQFWFFAVWLIFFKFSKFPLLKGKQNPLSISKTSKGHEKRERLLISKMEINYEISQCNQILPIDPVFSNWVNVNKKVSITNCPVNSKSFKAIFLFEIQKLKILKKNESVFVSVSLGSLLFSNCQLAMFALMACLQKLYCFRELIRSMKQLEIFQSFIAELACLEKPILFANGFSLCNSLK